MQLLTASKLSTVAMLAMAAVLVQSPVSAVPMEQSANELSSAQLEQSVIEEVPIVQVAPAIEEVVPSPKAPVGISEYKTVAPGQPSEQANQDILEIGFMDEPQAREIESPPLSDDVERPFDTLPDEMLQEVAGRLDKESVKNFAHTSKRHLAAVNQLQLRAAQKLKARLDEAWEKYELKLRAMKELDEQHYKGFYVLTPVWEEVVQQASDQEPKDCPYDLLPYNFKVDMPPAQGPDDEELAELARNTNHRTFNLYAARNVCRLAVNDAYPWLLRILTMQDEGLGNVIFSVLGQLRVYTSDKDFAKKLDKALKLFAAITQANSQLVTVSDHLKYRVMVSTPAVNSVFRPSEWDLAKAGLLILAVKQHQSGADVHLNVGEENLLDAVEVGNVVEFLSKLGPALEKCLDLSYLTFSLMKQITKYNKRPQGTPREVITKAIDHPSSAFISNERFIQTSLSDFILVDFHPLEVLVRLLPGDQFKHFYKSMFKSRKPPALIAVTGGFSGNSGLMKNIFKDIFGPKDTSIPEDLDIDGRRVGASSLAELALSCAIACTEKNWGVFVGLFVNKVHSTHQLPGNAVIDSSSSAAVAQEVADKIHRSIENLSKKRHEKGKGKKSRNKAVKSQVDPVIAKLKALAAALSHPLDNILGAKECKDDKCVIS